MDNPKTRQLNPSKYKWKKLCSFVHNKTLQKLVKRIALLLCIWLIAHLIIITVDGLWDEVGQADLAVVLGNKIEADGTPSKRLKDRLDKTISLYRQGYFKYILVSGGIGKEGFDEASVMKKYLVDHNIPADIIFEDNRGINTFHTAQNTKNFLKQNNLTSAFIITTYYHISRTKLAFWKAGINPTYSAYADLNFELRDPYSLLREFIGYYSYVLKPLY